MTKEPNLTSFIAQGEPLPPPLDRAYFVDAATGDFVGRFHGFVVYGEETIFEAIANAIPAGKNLVIPGKASA